MTPFKCILAISLPERHAGAIRHFIGNASRLARWWNATLHVLIPSEHKQIAEETLGRSSGVIVHVKKSLTARSILDSAKSYSCDLITFAERAGSPDLANHGKGTPRALLQESVSPVLILPKGVDLGTPPVRSFIVPLSGEKRQSQGLGLALTLAKQTQTPVDILHVAPLQCPCPCGASLETVGDEIQHEYPELVKKTVAAASPFSDSEERSHVRYFWHASGLTSKEILQRSRQSPGSALVVEWKGTLETGHAATLKEIIKDFRYPILFVKVEAEARSRLKVGKDFKAA
jgi:hypothetical protein